MLRMSYVIKTVLQSDEAAAIVWPRSLASTSKSMMLLPMSLPVTNPRWMSQTLSAATSLRAQLVTLWGEILGVANGDEVWLVATRDIAGGEAITRNYAPSPQLLNDQAEGALRLLLQFGLPPKSWPKSDAKVEE